MKNNVYFFPYSYDYYLNTNKTTLLIDYLKLDKFEYNKKEEKKYREKINSLS